MRVGLISACQPTLRRPFVRGAGTPFPYFLALSKEGMERREAPGRCATAPLWCPVRYAGHRTRLCGQVCETCPEARAPRSGGFARPTARTLRLPALHPAGKARGGITGRIVGGPILVRLRSA